jgi:hypothetical protein
VPDAEAEPSDLDAGLDVVVPVWPWVDSACSPPPLDASAESSIPLTDAGLSTVTTLPDGGSPQSVAVDDSAVYWTDYASSGVWSAPLAGGPPQVVADVGTPDPVGIAVDDAYVFWISRFGQRILRCPKGATGCTPYVVLAPFQGNGMALDAHDVYATGGGSIVACAKTGCRNAPTTIASGLGTVYDLTVQGDTLFLLDYPPTTSWSPQIYADVVKCPVTGCGNTPTVLASDVNPSGLATDGRYVYWVSQVQADQPASIKRCAVCGCGGTPEVILPAEAGVMTDSVLTDGVHLFFVDGPGAPMPDRVLACSVDGCGSAPTELFSDPSFWSLALGSGRLVVIGQTQILSSP